MLKPGTYVEAALSTVLIEIYRTVNYQEPGGSYNRLGCSTVASSENLETSTEINNAINFA